jgi:hypothetical protein
MERSRNTTETKNPKLAVAAFAVLTLPLGLLSTPAASTNANFISRSDVMAAAVSPATGKTRPRGTTACRFSLSDKAVAANSASALRIRATLKKRPKKEEL